MHIKIFKEQLHRALLDALILICLRENVRVVIIHITSISFILAINSTNFL